MKPLLILAALLLVGGQIGLAVLAYWLLLAFAL